MEAIAASPHWSLSIVWSLGVWWFGEGLGGVFHGRRHSVRRWPRGVLFYAVLAVLLWPSEGSDRPFVAARSVGVTGAQGHLGGRCGAFWPCLSVVGSGRSPQALHDLVAGLDTGQPGWLAHIDRSPSRFSSITGRRRPSCWPSSVWSWPSGCTCRRRSPSARWFWPSPCSPSSGSAVQDFGGILAGGATDPNSGPLVIMLALIYWPLTDWSRPDDGAVVGRPSAVAGG